MQMRDTSLQNCQNRTGTGYDLHDRHPDVRPRWTVAWEGQDLLPLTRSVCYFVTRGILHREAGVRGPAVPHGEKNEIL